jgi:RHH-type transcriptional regulator, rel operon repressor / antitoxin RelB
MCYTCNMTARNAKKAENSAAPGVVRIPKALDDRLSRIAAKTGRAKTYYASKALERYLEDMEDYLLAATAVEEMKAKGKKRGKSLDAVAKRLGLAGDL